MHLKFGNRITQKQLPQVYGAMLLVLFYYIPITINAQEQHPDVIKSSTLKIYGSGSPGSGVIIGSDGENYYALTAAHVIKGTSLSESPYVVTYDGKKHVITKIINGIYLDMSEIWFKASDSYLAGKLGRLLQDNTRIIAAGYPVNSDNLRISTESIINKVAVANLPATTPIGRPGGYGLRHTATTQTGMSGGGIWTKSGILVGIHGQADIYKSSDQTEARKTGGSLGIPITFYSLALQNGGLDRANESLFPPLRSAADFAVQAKYMSSIGRLEEAIQMYGEAIARSPGDADSWVNRGNIRVLQKRYEEALNDYQRAIALYPNRSETLTNMGTALIMLNRQAEALPILLKALEINPTNPGAWTNIAKVYKFKGRYIEADEASKKANLYRTIK